MKTARPTRMLPTMRTKPVTIAGVDASAPPSIARVTPRLRPIRRAVAPRPRWVRWRAWLAMSPGPMAGSSWLQAPMRTWTTQPTASGAAMDPRDHDEGTAPSHRTRPPATMTATRTRPARPADSTRSGGASRDRSSSGRGRVGRRARGRPARSRRAARSGHRCAPPRRCRGPAPGPRGAARRPSRRAPAPRSDAARCGYRRRLAPGWSRVAATTTDRKPKTLSQAWAGLNRPHRSTTGA